MIDREIMLVLPDAAKTDDYMSTPEVHRRLSVFNADTPVVKTVQRRLERMLDAGLVDADRRGTALFWRKKAGAIGLAAKASGTMTHDEALALQMLRRFSSRQIPSLVAETLSPVFDIAERRLESVNTDGERRYRKWAEKVEVESGGFSLKYPAIDSKIFSAVSQALFYEHQLKIVYRPRARSDNIDAKLVHPLGLVEVGGLVYLVASMKRYPQPAMYRLDRLSSAEMLAQPFDYPRDFTLYNYVRQQRQFDFMVEGEVSLKLRFFSGAGDHLLEAPLADDQEVVRADRHIDVSGTVLLSQRLRWWLRSFGPNVEVLAPASLRAELAAESRALAAMYQGTA